jgi:Zn-dependent peptidase ImmA (M78 family)
VELPTLTRGTVTDYLRRQGVLADDLGDPADVLAGFVFAAGRAGWAFVSATDPLPRRRFTAAHELGHFVMHRETMGRFRADTDATLREADDGVADRMEREANRFAADLLMPEDVCKARAVELRERYGCCPRGILVYRLSSELLVSREALRNRLQSLEVGDE